MPLMKESSAWAEEHQRRKLDFEWSLRPMTTLMRCIGIPLDFRDYLPLVGGRCSWCVTGFALLLFFVDAECQFGLTVMTVSETMDSQSWKNLSHSAAFKWNNFINSINYIILVLGSHFVLLAVSPIHWPHLVRVLHSIEQTSFYNERDFKKFRIPCLVGLAASAMEVLISFTFIWSVWNDSSFFYQLLIIGTFLFHILVLICFYYFCILCWIAYLMMNALGKDIKAKDKQRSSQLKLWKATYYLTTEFVHYINCCFGPFTFLLTTSYFVRMTNNSFFIFSVLTNSQAKTHNTKLYTLILLLIKDWISFVALTYIPSVVRQEAVKITRKLQNLDFEDISLKSQAEFLRMEVSLSLPQMTAAGFFDIDCKLIPTMVGTTLTYLIILYQFHSNEKENLDSTT